MNYSMKEVLKVLNITNVTLYKYLKQYKDLENYREKKKNKYYYSDKFIEEFKKYMNGEVKVIENEYKEPEKNILLDELKKQYEERIDELKTDKSDYKNQVNKLQDELKNNTAKIETLLLQLLKVTGETKNIEQKKEDINPENIVKEVKESIEKNKKEKTQQIDELNKVKDQLQSANDQAKEYNKFRKEQEQIIERIKEEYNRTKFFQIIKRSKLKKELEREYNKKFEFIHYVV